MTARGASLRGAITGAFRKSLERIRHLFIKRAASFDTRGQAWSRRLGKSLGDSLGEVWRGSRRAFRRKNAGTEGRPLSDILYRVLGDQDSEERSEKAQDRSRGEGAWRLNPQALADSLRSSLTPLAIAALGAAILYFALLALRGPAFPLPETGLSLGQLGREEALLTFITPELAPAADMEIPLTLPKSLEVERYTVRSGDSLGGIAARFRLKVDSIVSMNGISSARALKAGTELKIPNMDGIVHVVGGGESLGSLARRYKIEIEALADANQLGSSVVHPGQAIFIPGGRLATAELKKVLGELAVWPVRGRISSPFGYRSDPFTGVRRFHSAIDIVAPFGTPVRSTMEGQVADLGYNAVYGNYVIVNHADGMQSLYGHLSSISVRRGQTLAQNGIIGALGNTGYSTGPHLHFGLFKRGAPVNPLKYVK